jgi:hypothetical protein
MQQNQYNQYLHSTVPKISVFVAPRRHNFLVMDLNGFVVLKRDC